MRQLKHMNISYKILKIQVLIQRMPIILLANIIEKTKLDSDINYKYDIKQLRKLLETNKN